VNENKTTPAQAEESPQRRADRRDETDARRRALRAIGDKIILGESSAEEIEADLDQIFGPREKADAEANDTTRRRRAVEAEIPRHRPEEKKPSKTK
jgi:hypothetical protein